MPCTALALLGLECHKSLINAHIVRTISKAGPIVSHLGEQAGEALCLLIVLPVGSLSLTFCGSSAIVALLIDGFVCRHCNALAPSASVCTPTITGLRISTLLRRIFKCWCGFRI